VDLEYRKKEVCLCITDDGRGFVLNNPAFTGNGHFGLVDMKGRAQSLGCNLLIESTPGKGTRVELQVPLVRKQITNNEEHKTHTYSSS
jgi:signal transduction histidine kinase